MHIVIDIDIVIVIVIDIVIVIVPVIDPVTVRFYPGLRRGRCALFQQNISFVYSIPPSAPLRRSLIVIVKFSFFPLF